MLTLMHAADFIVCKAGAAVLDIGECGCMSDDIPAIETTYWPHRENYNRLQSSALD